MADETTEEIKITPAMIARGVVFCEENALGVYSNRLVQEEFTELFLRYALNSQRQSFEF